MTTQNWQQYRAAQQVLDFWFTEITPEQWWIKDIAFDRLISQRFATVLQLAAQGELALWRDSAKGRLAEIIILDQFSRNIHRDTPMAFAQDNMALALAQEALRTEAQNRLSVAETTFLLMPFMHSESAYIHQQAAQLFKQYTPDNNYQFELKHKAIIDRFGRYPHRNAILGRQSSAEELAFLQLPGSSF